MQKQLRLSLLGKPKFEQGGQPLASTLIKGQALLIYLAVTRQPHSRSALSGLLWSDMPEVDARTNLRVTLSQLKKTAGDVFTATRRTVELNADGNVWLDVAVLEEAAHNGNDLAMATKLYRGDFLDDFEVLEAALFEEWVLVERERLRQLGIGLLEQLADTSLKAGDYLTGIDAARQLLSIDPWYEDAHQQLMKLLAEAGQSSAALAQYETCRQLLAEEFGLEPTTETVALYEAIRAGTFGHARSSSSTVEPARKPASAVPLPPHNLPATTSSFIGRQEEQSKIVQLMTEADCRLLTIIGPGGIGKTRLAQTVASDHLKPNTPYHNGVYFIPLNGLNLTPGQIEAKANNPIVSTIGTSLGLSFSGKASLMSQLLDAVREKSMLLVLDNFEHLIDFAELVVDILAQAPGLHVIITSRERLSLYEECVFDLGGLPYPITADDSTRPETFDSIQLFDQCARRVHQDFDLRAELPDVAHICRLLGGMPLALELAAAWVRTLSCQHIAQEIRQNLDFLSARTRNVPERQRSMRTVFDYSWRSLTAEEQTVFKKLSVFAGGFSLDAAGSVAETSTSILANLVDQSLVRQERSGRYRLHELLRQYSLAKLKENQAAFEDTKDQHCNYFANYVQQRDFDKEREVKKSLIDRDIEFDNIHAAWDWALEQGRVQDILLIHLGLGELYETSGRYAQGLELFQQASAKLNHIYQKKIEKLSADHQAIGEIYSQLLSWQAWFGLRLGRYDQAKMLLAEALSISSQASVDNAWHHAYPTFLLGLIDWYLGKNESAREYLIEALAISQRTNGLFISAACLTHLGLTEANVGNYKAAKQHHQDCLQICETIGIPSVFGIQYSCLGRLAYFQQDYAQAEQLLLQSVQLCRVTNHYFILAFGLTYLGLVQSRLAQAETGKQTCVQALSIFNKIGEPYGQALALDHLGQISWALDDYEQAKHHFLETLQISLKIDTKPQTLSALLGLARYLAQSGQPKQAEQLLAYVANHSASGYNTKAAAHRLLIALNDQPTLQPPMAALSDDQIEEFVQGLLRNSAN